MRRPTLAGSRFRTAAPGSPRQHAGTIFLILVLALIGELSLCLWLMVKGVNVAKWNEKARLASG